MRNLATSRRSCSFARAGQLAATVALTIIVAGGCGSVNSAGGDAAAGASGQGGRAGDGAGGSTGSAGSMGAAGSGIAGTTGNGGSSTGSGGSNGGAASAGRGGNGGAAGATGSGGGGGAGSTGSGGSIGGRGGNGGGGGGGSGGRGGAGGTAGTGGSSGGGGAAGSPCQAVLALDRSCTTAADCFAGAHTSNCCGQVQFIGFSSSMKTQFQTLEAQCDATYPACGCAAQQPTADDGSRLRFNDQAGVTCVQGKCTTFVPDCGKPCGAGTTCFSCIGKPANFASCTKACNDSTQCTETDLPLCQMGESGNTAGKFCTTANVACDTR